MSVDLITHPFSFLSTLIFSSLSHPALGSSYPLSVDNPQFMSLCWTLLELQKPICSVYWILAFKSLTRGKMVYIHTRNYWVFWPWFGLPPSHPSCCYSSLSVVLSCLQLLKQSPENLLFLVCFVFVSQGFAMYTWLPGDYYVTHSGLEIEVIPLSLPSEWRDYRHVLPYQT